MTKSVWNDECLSADKYVKNHTGALRIYNNIHKAIKKKELPGTEWPARNRRHIHLLLCREIRDSTGSNYGWNLLETPIVDMTQLNLHL